MPDSHFKILTLNNISVTGLRRLPRERYEVASEIGHPHAILVRSHNMHDMQIPPSVLAVARAGAGVNNIPVDALSARGVPVFNAPGANANAVKELVLGALFLAARNLCQAYAYVRELKAASEAELAAEVEAAKKRFVGFELPGRTLGVIGLGAIGVEVANAALDLGMKVIGYDPKITVRRAWQLSAGVQQAPNLDDVFDHADVITAHVPLLDDTRGLVSRDRLRLMPKHGVVLNFARKGIVDEEAIQDALTAGALAYYVTDFPTLTLKDHPRVVALPHLGASTAEAEENCAVMVADHLREFLEDGNVRHSVNFPDAILRRTRPNRLSIANANVPGVVGHISTCLAEADINIADLLNKSRGDLAYTLVDLDGPLDDETLRRLADIGGILAVRSLPETAV